MLAHLADINERDFRQPACQKKSLACWFSGITKQYSGVLGRLQDHGRGIPSRRNTVGHLYFAKVLAVIKNVLSVDLKGVFESLNIIFKTFSYHMGILMQIKIYRSKNLALISSEKHWPDTNNTNHEVNIPAIKIVDAIPDSYCPFHTPGK